jgi:hypothetical protein
VSGKRETFENTRNPHGLYTFCCGVIVGVVICVGVAFLAAVNS